MYELRELECGDVSEVNGWRHDLISFLGSPYRHIGPEVDGVWFDAYLSCRATTVRCAVVDSGDPGRILGLVTLSGIDWVHRNAELHIMVGREEDRGHGVGTFAVREMLSHAFFDLGLHRVELDALVDNSRAIRAYERVGFRREEVCREAAFKGEHWTDLVHMALFADEWVGSGGVVEMIGLCSVRAVWRLFSREFDSPLEETVPDFGSYVEKVAERAVTLAALRGGCLVGAVSFYANDLSAGAYVTQLAVAFPERGGGIGGMLLDCACERAERLGMGRIGLEVREDNSAARRLYERRGFRYTGAKGRYGMLMERGLG